VEGEEEEEEYIERLKYKLKNKLN